MFLLFLQEVQCLQNVYYDVEPNMSAKFVRLVRYASQIKGEEDEEFWYL